MTLPEVEQIIIAQVDPDAVGAALGLQLLMNDAEIFYAGKIGHPQNVALFNKLNLNFKTIDQLDTSKTSALVDSCQLVDSRLPVFQHPPDIVIDHHRGCDFRPTWSKIDEEVGAASTLVAEMLSQMTSSVATALALGIYTDTKGLRKSSKRDRTAYYRCAAGADGLDALIDYTLPFDHWKRFAKLIESAQFSNGRILAGMGYLDASVADDLATAADRLLRTTGCALVVTWGIVDDKVRICARSSDLNINLNELLKGRFGDRSGAKMHPDGVGEGGALLDLDLGAWLEGDEAPVFVGKRLTEWLMT